MKQLRVFVVLFVAAVALADEKPKSFLKDGRAHGKLARLMEDSRDLATAYRNLVLDTPGSKVKLADYANEVVQAFHSSAYRLNQGIASIKIQALRESQCQIPEGLTAVAYDIQRHLCGDSEKLKEALVAVCEKFITMGPKLANALESHDCEAEIFYATQLRKSLIDGTYTAQKVKLQIDHGKKTNKELVVEMDAALEEFIKRFPNIQSNDHKTKDELIYLIQNLERIAEVTAAKLENFVLIDSDDRKNNAIAQEVSIGLSSASVSLSLLASENQDASHLATGLEKIHKLGTAVIKKLCDIDVPQNTPGDLLVRSVLFDNLAVSKMYEGELKQLAQQSAKATKN